MGLRFCLALFGFAIKAASAKRLGGTLRSKVISERSSRVVRFKSGRTGRRGRRPLQRHVRCSCRGRADASICGSSRVKKCTHLFGRSQKREIRNCCQSATVSDFLFFSKKMFFREFVMMCSICSILKMPPYHGFCVFI